MSKLWVISLLLILTTSSCKPTPQLVSNPNVPPPVRADDSARCWMQQHYQEFPDGMKSWLREQENQEYLLRRYHKWDLNLPPAKCETPKPLVPLNSVSPPDGIPSLS